MHSNDPSPFLYVLRQVKRTSAQSGARIDVSVLTLKWVRGNAHSAFAVDEHPLRHEPVRAKKVHTGIVAM